MNIEQLLQRIQLGEDSTLELKKLLLRDDGKTIEPHPDSLSDELAALANAKGGMVILGVDDKTREVSGIALSHLDRVETWVTAICNDRIKPPLDIATYHLQLPDSQGILQPVIVVEVPQSLWVHQSANGYFRRVGHAKRELQPDALARLFQQRSQARIIRFEEQVVPNASVNDIDPLLIRPFLRVDDGAPEQQLQRLHLLTSAHGVLLPTVAGVLLCTPEPQRWLRNAEIIAAAYTGQNNDANEQIDAKIIGGPLDRQIWDALHFVKRNMKTPAKKALGRVDYPQYSLRAVFEAIVNAVAHRDYSIYGGRIRLLMFEDRLELYSPGALPNTMRIETMTRMSLPRNDVLCSLFAAYYPMQEMGFGRSTLMDRRGMGVNITLDESEQLSGKRPIYENLDDMELKLTIFAAQPPNDAVSS